MLCIYCGNDHPSNICQLRAALPFDIYGEMRFSIRVRATNTKCVYCGGTLQKGELFLYQKRRSRGIFSKTCRAHLQCLLSELQKSREDYLQRELVKDKRRKEIAREKARANYRRKK